jgi:hypothetical protein
MFHLDANYLNSAWAKLWQLNVNKTCLQMAQRLIDISYRVCEYSCIVHVALRLVPGMGTNRIEIWNTTLGRGIFAAALFC